MEAQAFAKACGSLCGLDQPCFISQPYWFWFLDRAGI
jgi:hypothetical protein